MTNITYGNTSNLSADELECADHCEHVEEDQSLGVKYSMESDSFGPVGVYIQCEECFEHTKEQDRHNTCYDCGEDKKTTQWKWYDFYAAQGDEALEICDDCWSEPKHTQRRQKDSYDEDQENNYQANLDDEFDD